MSSTSILHLSSYSLLNRFSSFGGTSTDVPCRTGVFPSTLWNVFGPSFPSPSVFDPSHPYSGPFTPDLCPPPPSVTFRFSVRGTPGVATRGRGVRTSSDLEIRDKFYVILRGSYPRPPVTTSGLIFVVRLAPRRVTDLWTGSGKGQVENLGRRPEDRTSSVNLLCGR